MTAASGVMQKLWTKPVAKSRASPKASVLVWPKTIRAPNHTPPLQSMTRPEPRGRRTAPTTSEPASAPDQKAHAR